MKPNVCTIIMTLAFLMLVQVLPVKGQEEQNQREWTGKTKNQIVITQIDLEIIIAEHKKWFETNGEDGKKADLSKADLNRADLSGANLNRANLSDANLIQADLHETYLHGADLSGADLSGANLIRARLGATNLDRAYLRKANLSEANLSEANLSEANLSGANLNGADLIQANLSGANLRGADLRGASLGLADLSGVIFEPTQESIPKIKYIYLARNISELKYINSPKALVMLREEFKKADLPKLEREITRAIKHTQMLNSWNKNKPFQMIKAAFIYVFIELTCQYGMRPLRPLLILICLIPFFSFFYIFALKTKKQKSGDMLIFSKQLGSKTTKETRPFKLPLSVPMEKQGKQLSRILQSYHIRMIRIAFYFSLLSATRLSWREFNIGHWISLLQRREYTLKAEGWMRTVSGLQSLISFYLLVLFVWTIFKWPWPF